MEGPKIIGDELGDGVELGDSVELGGSVAVGGNRREDSGESRAEDM